MLEISVSETGVVNESSASSLEQLVSTTPSEGTSESIHRVQLNSFLRALKGRFIGVDFVKKDGSVRALNGRLGVHSLSKGGENKVVSDSRPYLTIFDAKAHEYRTLNLATVSTLRANRKTYSIVG